MLSSRSLQNCELFVKAFQQSVKAYFYERNSIH